MIRTGYSSKVAYGKLPDVLSRLKECEGYGGYAPIADFLSTHAFRRWRDLCEKESMIPVFGVELPVATELNKKKAPTDRWFFMAKNSLRDLHDLIHLATSRSIPALTYREACEAQGVIKITGNFCMLGEMFPGQDIYIGLSPATPMNLFKQAYDLGHQFCATSCNYYPRAEDKETYRVAIGRPGKSNRANTQTYPMWILTDEEWRAAVEWFVPGVQQECAIINRDFILHRCKAEIKPAELIRPERNATLLEMCMVGAAKRGINLGSPEYLDRLTHELEVIAEKQFEDYFFIVAEMMQWAREHMLVGPGRGSSAGSLVCYLLGITNIDPIVHGTMFERFIDPTRNDYPDIDSDFSDERRELLFEHMAERYGRDHVARLGTMGFFGPKSALKQAASMLTVPAYEVSKFTDEDFVKAYSGDARADLRLFDTFEQTDLGRAIIGKYPELAIATTIEAHPTNPSQHAAGLLLTQSAIADCVAVDARTNCAMLDLEDASKLNLLKIDCLGLTQLSIFERCLKLIGIEENPNDFFARLPLDYAPAFDVVDNQHYCGIFQFNGEALQSLARRVTKIDRFDDLVALSALGRPGPMKGGAAERWVKRRNGEEAVTVIHPCLAACTAETYGVIVYQEQVIHIARHVGGMSIGDANKIRKVISKTVGDEAFAQFGKPFIEGAMHHHNMNRETAEEIWQAICGMGAYAFNKSHAVAYGVVSYYCAWLKAKYPVEFAAATLDSERDPEKQIAILRELRAEGVAYIPFDAELSGEHWQVATKKEGGNIPWEQDLGSNERRVLIGPITNLVSVGPAAMQEILDARRKGEQPRQSLLDRIKDAITPIDTIYPYRDAIARVCPDPVAANILTTPETVEQLKAATIVRHEMHVLMGVLVRVIKKDYNSPEAVKNRGYMRKGKTLALNLYVRDDSGELLCKIEPNDYDTLGKKVLDQGEIGNAIYAIRGRLSQFNDTRMLNVDNVRFLGVRAEKIIRKIEDVKAYDRRSPQYDQKWKELTEICEQRNIPMLHASRHNWKIVGESKQDRIELIASLLESGKLKPDCIGDDLNEALGLARKHA